MSSIPIEMNIPLVNVEKLLEHLLKYRWQYECKIICDFLPPCSRHDTKPKLVVYHPYYESFLRYSRGPHSVPAWDVYGDDFQTVELALIALMNAPAPHCGSVTVRQCGSVE